MLHIERLSQSIDKMGKHILIQSASHKSDLTIATTWLKEHASTDLLMKRLNSITERERRWEGALPCTEQPLEVTLSVQQSRPESTTVIGIDGSQIFPDRHAAVTYYLIQCGALIYRYDGGLPEPRNVERLYFEDDVLFDSRGYLISNDAIGIQRMVQEMQFVADLSAYERNKHPNTPIFALIDGPLLWSYPESEQHISPEFEAYLSALTKIQQSGVVPVGYVDRPGGKWFLNTLWFNQLEEGEPLPQVDSCPVHTLTDARLMSIMLAPGERTSWYKRHNPSQTTHARVDQEIWFCYMNLGEEERPTIARIETPKWFAKPGNEMATLHNLLLHQAQVLNGYPYVLARAHEQALVTTQDKTALDNLLERKLMEQGYMPRKSEKARQKSYLGHR